MGLFNLFKKSNTPQSHINIKATSYVHKDIRSEHERETLALAKERKVKAIPSKNGLYPHEILMIYYAPTYKTSGNNFPRFWLYEYYVDDPQKVLSALASRGYIQPASVVDSMSRLTIAQLKDILTEYGLGTSGKKADLVARLQDNVPEDSLSSHIHERFYSVTILGDQELAQNEYVIYYHKHKSAYFLNLWEMNKLIQKSSSPNYRDIIWGHLNAMVQDSFYEIQHGNYRTYISIKKSMAEFLMEEERYLDALRSASEATYYELNIEAPKNYKTHLELLQYEVPRPKKLPTFESYIKGNILNDYNLRQYRNIQSKLNLSNDELFALLADFFSKLSCPQLIISSKDTAGLIVSELEESEVSSKIYNKLEKSIGKKLQ